MRWKGNKMRKEGSGKRRVEEEGQRGSRRRLDKVGT